jgi:hypothetical protein
MELSKEQVELLWEIGDHLKSAGVAVCELATSLTEESDGDEVAIDKECGCEDSEEDDPW